MKGVLITFEGIDYSGKSTQFELLRKVLETLNIPFISFREPGFDKDPKELEEKIRNLLLDKKNNNMTFPTEVYLFQAARAQIYGARIIPAVNDCKIALGDRSGDSSVAYQGYGRYFANPKKVEMIKNYNKFSMQGQKIARTYYVDISVEEMAKRKFNNGRADDRLDNLELAFYERVRKGYLDIAKEEPDRIMLIDGTKSVEEIHSIILDDFRDILCKYGQIDPKAL